MQTPQIRPMAPRDITVVTDMIAALSAEHKGCARLDADALALMVFGPVPALRVLVAEGAAGLVGVAGFASKRPAPDLTHLYVKPRARGMGIGRALTLPGQVAAIHVNGASSYSERFIGG